MRKGFLFLVLMLIVGLALPAQAVIELSVVSVPDGERAPLYGEPSEGVPLLTLYSGATVIVEEVTGDWAKVSVGSSYFQAQALTHGYMPADCIDSRYHSGQCSLIDTQVPIAQLTQPSNGHPAGTRVMVCGEYQSGALLVCISGEIYFSVSPNALALQSETALPFSGLPTLGYAQLKPDSPVVCTLADGADVFTPQPFVRVFSAPDAIDGWLQVGNTFQRGFVAMQNVESVYWLEDMLLPDAAALDEGEYRVGEDMAAGLYTLQGGESARLTVSLENGAQLVHQPQSDAPYTVYLAPNAVARVEGGTLSPAQAGYVVSDSEPWQYMDGGRLLYGVQLPRDPEYQQIISLHPEAGEGSYRIVPLSADAGAEVTPIAEDTLSLWDEPVALESLLPEGCFIELNNCVLESRWGNG